MEIFLKNRQFLNILLLICLVGFFTFPKAIFAEDLQNINQEEIGKYLELSEKDANKLMDTLRQVLTTEGISAWGSGDVSDEETAVVIILLKVVTMEALNHLLVDAPLKVAQKIIKSAIDIVQIYINPAVFWEKFEKFTVEKAIEEAKKQLFQNEIKVVPGAIKFKYDSYKGGEKEIVLQYVMIYKSERNSKKANIVIRFYMPNSIEAPITPKYGSITSLYVPDLKKDLPPFIVEINGRIEKDKDGSYWWIDEQGRRITEGPDPIFIQPLVKIDFPPTVPDLGIKPLSRWEKYVLKPIENTIKDIEIIITKVTGKSPKLVDIWDKIKATFSKINPFGPAALVETPLPEQEESLVEIGQDAGQEILEKTETESPSIEVRLQQSQLSFGEVEKMLKDISQKIDSISKEADDLREKENKIIENEEEIEEETSEKEVKEKKTELKIQKDEAALCQKIEGSMPSRAQVIFNEIAWMGTTNSANDEWFELKNISGKELDLTGWQILDKENQIKIVFATDTISTGGFFLLERTNDDSAPGVAADFIYTGALSNTNETLYLFDGNCQLQDEVLAEPNWPAGDNSSKRTMERKNDLNWQTSAHPGGTPKMGNSSGYVEVLSSSGGGSSGGGGGVSVSSPPASPSTPQFSPVIINEIMYNPKDTDTGREWIEIFNNGESAVDLTNWKFYEDGTNHKLTLIQGSNILSSKGYAIIANNEKLLDYPDYSGILFKSTFSLKNEEGEEIAIKNEDLIIDKVNYDPSLGAGGDGNSLQKFNSQWLAAPPTPGRENKLFPSVLEVSTTNLSFEAIEGVKKPADQSLIIQNSGGGNLNWQIFFSTDWLKFDQLEGSIPANSSSTINVSVVDINEFATGTYSATFNIEAAGNNPQTISVNLIVYEKKFAQNVVISEVQIASTSSTDDEFIEIYNPDDTLVDLSQWSIQKSYSTSTTVYKKNFENGNEIPAKGYFLIVYASGTDQNLLNLAGLTLKTFSLSQNNTIYLVANQDKIENASDADIIDMVGFGENVFAEENPASNPPAGKSLGRKIAVDDEGNLNYLDLDNNRLDFEIQEPTPGKQNENLPPVAKFDFSPENPYVGDNILLDTSFSNDPDGTIATYAWDFGDGSSTSTTSSKITKFFSTSSNFIISLSVVDDSGAISTPTTTQIFVRSREPLSIVINEIAWMGTKASSFDKWIELYNPTSEDIDIINWSIFGAKTESCLNLKDADGFSTMTILGENFLIYANHKESITTLTGQSIVDIWDDEIEMDDISPGQLILYDASNCQGDLIDVVGEVNEGWFAGNALNFISIERISATTTGAISTNWASNNLITRNSLDAGSPPNKINGTPREENSVSKKENIIDIQNFKSLFDEFPEITLTYLGSPYIIGDNPYGNTLSVPQGTTLNIEPGVVLKFVASALYYGSGMEIGGTLKAIGEENKPIIFTRYEESPGSHWVGIYFSSTSQNSILDRVVLEKARSWNKLDGYSAIKVDQSSVSFKNLILENFSNRWGILFSNSSSTIALSTFSGFNDSAQGLGPSAIYLSGGSPTIKNSIFKKNTYGIKMEQEVSPIIEGNNFKENEYPIYALDSYPSLSENQFTNNNVNGILIKGNLSQNTTWKTGITYVIDYYVGVMASTTLNIEPGTVVKFKAASGAPGYQAYFIVASYSSLIAQGTESSKIIFTSFNDDEYGGDTNNNGTSTAPNYWDWKEITFNSGASGFLKWVIIRYGGWFTNQPLVIKEGDNVNVSHENVIIEFSSQQP